MTKTLVKETYNEETGLDEYEEILVISDEE